MTEPKVSKNSLPQIKPYNTQGINQQKIQTSADIFSPENLKKNTAINIDPDSEQNKFYNFVEKNSNEKLTPKEEKALYEKAKKGIEDRNEKKSVIEKYTDGIKQDYKEGKIGDRIANNPVAKASGLLLGGLTSCSPIDEDGYYDLVKVDYTDPVTMGPVNANCMEFIKALGTVMVTDKTPIQQIKGNDPTQNRQFELNIDKDNSTADKIIYKGTVTDTKTFSVKEIRSTVVQNGNRVTVTEEVNESKDVNSANWTTTSKFDYGVDDKGRAAKFKDDKQICYYRANVGEQKLYIYNMDGSKAVINDFDATQIHGKLKM